MFSKIIVTPNYFPTKWCDDVNNWMLKNVEADTNFGTKGIRKCTVRMLKPNMKPFNGVFSSLIGYVKSNHPKLDVDIDYKIDGPIQHITYNQGDNVGWHDDTMTFSSAMSSPLYSDLKTDRKLSMTVMLSDPNDYQGGKFVFDPAIKLPCSVEGKGTVALFTSFSKHMVEEITSGTRNILFIFLTGPNWR